MCTRLRIYILTDYVLFFQLYMLKILYFSMFDTILLYYERCFFNVYKNLHFICEYIVWILEHTQYSGFGSKLV